MSNIDKRALRVLATALDGDDWHAEGNSVYGGRYDVGDNVCYDHIASCESVNGKSPHADFIAAANPATVLALLDEMEALKLANAAQDDHINQQQDRIDLLEKGNNEAARQINSWRRLAKHNIAEREKDVSELNIARKRIAELEATQGKPVMFIDGDISPVDAEKLAAVIREFNEETETPAARMARIIRENPHPTNMCDMPVAAAGKGE
ncbi:TPA: ead/Ea22-like family protein [Enterobacter hormaechei]|nr:ead/Ea22-like family protein [Enterobacter hormaechei]